MRLPDSCDLATREKQSQTACSALPLLVMCYIPLMTGEVASSLTRDRAKTFDGADAWTIHFASVLC